MPTTNYAKWSERKKLPHRRGPSKFQRICWTPLAIDNLRRLLEVEDIGSAAAAERLNTSLDAIYKAARAFGVRLKPVTPPKSEDPRVQAWMDRYQVRSFAVLELGLERLERMGEEARAYLLRDIDRHGARTAPGRASMMPRLENLVNQNRTRRKPVRRDLEDAAKVEELVRLAFHEKKGRAA